jgi:hypothetical protein
MFKRIVNKIFKKNVVTAVNDPKPIQLDGLRIISLWTAGVKYESRINNVLNCKVHEEVLLEREPNNEIDINAIHVKTLNGLSLGYVGRLQALKIAPLIDEKKIVSKAYIIDLKCNLSKDIYGVKIAFSVNPEDSSVFDQKVESIDVFFDKSENDNLYLLLKCEESILKKVKDIFKQYNINIYRTGISYRIAKNGKYYDWYFFLDEKENQENIQKLLEERFPILKEKSENKFKDEYYSFLEDDYHHLEKEKKKLIEEDIPLKERELNVLKINNNQLIEENSRLKYEIEKSLKSLNQVDNQLEKIISILYPKVEFINPSFDVLQREVLDFTNAIEKIQKIVEDENFKGTPIKTCRNWFDTHFSTGERNDGRIYFRKTKDKTTILVSFKSEQTKDIKRLLKYK